MLPKVSICIPAYCQPISTARAVSSVFSQTFQDFELIVTDDSETDEVVHALAPWLSDPRLIYRRNPLRLGTPENWNASLSLARSDLIKFLHHDDWFSSDDSLASFVRAMDANPQANFAFSSANACREDGAVIFLHQPQPEQIKLLRERPWELQFANFIGAPSATMFRRKEGFHFDKQLKWVVDIDAYLKILGVHPNFEFIPEALVCITADGANQVTQSLSTDRITRVVEHLYLYTYCLPPGLAGRYKGFLFISEFLSQCSRLELEEIRTRLTSLRQGTEENRYIFKQPIEERMVMYIRGLKSLAGRVCFALQNKAKPATVAEKIREDRARFSYSQSGEDMIIDFLMMWLGCAQITYLDIGAHHPTWLSNTYHFYKMGHRGVLIEPDSELCEHLSSVRPNDKVLNLAVNAEGDNVVSMYVMTSRTLNTLDKEQAEALQQIGRERIEEVREVRQLGINQLLEEHFIAAPPSLVSLDIEGLDLELLKAWDFDRFRPKVFCVETITYTQDNTERKLTEIIDFMSSQHYKVYADTYINTIFVCQDAWQKRPIYA